MWVVRKVQGGIGHKSEGVGGYGGGGMECQRKNSEQGQGVLWWN